MVKCVYCMDGVEHERVCMCCVSLHLLVCVCVCVCVHVFVCVCALTPVTVVKDCSVSCRALVYVI